MAQVKEKSGILEGTVIVALLLLLWYYCLRKKPAKKPTEPAMTPEEIEAQFKGDPDFNLNDYCQNIIYKPLSNLDLTASTLLGKGWCYRGDRSIVDEKKGFGDPYADKQAKDYVIRKQNEAILVNNKLYVQFKLINSTAAPITTDILNTMRDAGIWDGTYESVGPAAPVSGAGTGVTESMFTANWTASSGATGYYIDVATDIGFLSMVAGYNNLDVGNVLTEAITGLIAGTTYYYRARAYNTVSTGSNSNIVTVTTLGDLMDIDGNIYHTIIIGNQEWIIENLKTTKYADGSAIPNPYAEVNLLTSWANISFDTFISSGADVISAIKAGGAFGVAKSNNATASQNEKWLFKVNLTRVSGVTPAMLWYDNNVVQGVIPLVDGQNEFPIDVYAGHDYAMGFYNDTAQAVNFGAICGMYNQFGYAWANDITGMHCFHNNDIANKAIYGALYNWYAITNVKGLAYLERSGIPEAGYRAATKTDYNTLITALGGALVAGGKLKESGLTHWLTPNTGADNSSGLTALGGSYRNFNGLFSTIKQTGKFSTSTDEGGGLVDILTLLNNSAGATVAAAQKAIGCSVRLVRDV
jgi:uncharacterized protein (TIGR02145 family)